MVKALEEAIIKGEGAEKNQPEGILTQKAPEGQNIDIAAGSNIKYEDLCNAEGALPSEYNGAEWAMTKKTYFGQVVAMTDSNGQPIARTNVGIDGKPQYTILGRQVNFIPSEYMADFGEVEEDTVVAFMFRFEDYMLNTNMNVTVSHYDDDETDDKMTKAIMLADGKVVDRNSFLTVTKKAAAKKAA
jgi:HK97 family phage major capsid protein